MNAGRPTLSIGQVLAALKGDFPDISVSKIRFLESEGLISPERTASGYRKFSEPDVERLRTILTLQRDAFLPLKVIRERLDAGETLASIARPPAAPEPQPMTMADPAAPATNGHSVTPPPVVMAVPEPVDELAEPEPVQLTEADLANETGLELAQIKQLREYGVLCDHQDQGALYFDADDVAVGRLARDLLRLGVDVRQLKSLRRSAEQEAGTYQQLVTPVLRNRRPEVRAQATETLRDIARLSREMRHTYLRRALRAALNGDR